MVKGSTIATLAAVAIGGFLIYSYGKTKGWFGAGDYSDPASGNCVPAWNIDIQGLGKPCCAGTHSYDPGLGHPAVCIPDDATSSEIKENLGDAYAPDTGGSSGFGCSTNCNNLPAPLNWACLAYQAISCKSGQPSMPDQPAPPSTAGDCIAALDASSMQQLVNYVAGLSASAKEQWRGYWLTRQPGCASMINAIADTY